MLGHAERSQILRFHHVFKQARVPGFDGILGQLRRLTQLLPDFDPGSLEQREQVRDRTRLWEWNPFG